MLFCAGGGHFRSLDEGQRRSGRGVHTVVNHHSIRFILSRSTGHGNTSNLRCVGLVRRQQRTQGVYTIGNVIRGYGVQDSVAAHEHVALGQCILSVEHSDRCSGRIGHGEGGACCINFAWGRSQRQGSLMYRKFGGFCTVHAHRVAVIVTSSDRYAVLSLYKALANIIQCICEGASRLSCYIENLDATAVQGIARCHSIRNVQSRCSGPSYCVCVACGVEVRSAEGSAGFHVHSRGRRNVTCGNLG